MPGTVPDCRLPRSNRAQPVDTFDAMQSNNNDSLEQQHQDSSRMERTIMSLTINTISPKELDRLAKSGQEVDLLDVRTPAEFEEVHA